MDENVEIAREVIRDIVEKNGLEIVKIILFGSRARGEYFKDSDWDFYVIVDKEITRDKKREITRKIRRKLAELKIPNDTIIQSSRLVELRKNDVGYLTHYVLKEGIDMT
ncbi:MAG: nucleotidyltransferase domain-containing protein [Candidatus Helarchaeales archaeon]